MVGDFAAIDAQDKTGKKAKNKKNKKEDNTPLIARPGGVSVTLPKMPVPKLATPSTKDAAALAKIIDAQINRKLADAGVTPSAICADEEFFRRAYLDITGVIPTADKAKAFLDDTAADKRAKLIDALLADPHYGRRMADIWTAKLYPRDSNNRFVLKDPLYKWLEAQFNTNAAWDQFVTKLVTATGTVADNPAVTYFLANRAVDKLADTTSQHFLGIQLQCAQCHNHPFTSWKQTEYWGMAAFYSKVKADRPKNGNKGGDNTAIGVQETNGRNKQKDFFPGIGEDCAGEVPRRCGTERRYR